MTLPMTAAHHINWYEIGVHVVSSFSLATLVIAFAHRIVASTADSLAVQYPNLGLTKWLGATGPAQKFLSFLGDWTAHMALLFRDFVAPKQQWDGEDRRGEIAKAQAAGK